MIFDRHFQCEITKFTHNCKERQEQFLTSCSKEEKQINAEFSSKLEVYIKRHRKKAERLHNKLQTKRKALHRKLEHELRVELRLFKRYTGLKSQSTGRINVYPSSNNGSVYSLEGEPVQNDSAHGNPDQNDAPSREKKANTKWSVKLFKRSSNKQPTEFANHADLEHTLKRLRHEMEQRLRYEDEEAKMCIAQLEWEFLLERQNVKRECLEALADFKQRRLSSLGQIKKTQIKGYFDIHRKWLINEHTRELTTRQQQAQDTLKRLATAQAIERQTVCRLARTTAKGCKQVNQAVSSAGTKRWPIETIDKSTASLVSRPASADISLADLLFPKSNEVEANAGELAEGRAEGRATYRAASAQSSALHKMDPGREPRAHSSHSISTQCEHENDHGTCSESSSRRLITNNAAGRIQSKFGLKQAKSVQSLHSNLETCDFVQRCVINTLSRQQVDQWAEILNHERSLTESLMQSHAEQKKALVLEETAALKRVQAEQESRAAHLAVVLEATEKFAEKEFTEERNRMTEYYFGKTEYGPTITQGNQLDYHSNELDSPAVSLNLPDISPSIRSNMDLIPVGTVRTSNMPTFKSSLDRPARDRVIIYREELKT